MKKEKNYVLVSKLSKDIDDLEKRLKHVNIENFKKFSIRNIKIFGRLMQLIAPFIVAIVLPYVGQSIIFDYPFIREDVKQEMNYYMELDSNGSITYQNQYENYSERSKLYLYGKWEQEDNGFYKRTVRKYKFDYKDINLEELKELVKNPSGNFEEIFGNPVSSVIEHKNKISDKELNSEGYIKAEYYYKDKDDFIIIKQSIGENIAFSLLYLFVTGVFIGLATKYRTDLSEYDFTEKVEVIEQRYRKTDPKVLEKKLEIKKNTLNRILGDNNG